MYSSIKLRNGSNIRTCVVNGAVQQNCLTIILPEIAVKGTKNAHIRPAMLFLINIYKEVIMGHLLFMSTISPSEALHTDFQ